MKQWFLLLSDIFSFITVALCLILKVPQIIRLIKSGQAAGLSFKATNEITPAENLPNSILTIPDFAALSVFLIVCKVYTVTMMYNYTNRHALLSYLEYPIIIIQEYILIGCVMHYKNYKPVFFLSILIFYVIISLGFAYDIFNKFILTLLLPLTIPVSAISKIMQLIEIISKNNADSVSTLTWFLSMFTNITRIYTTYVDSADTTLLLNYFVSSFLSAAVMGAAFYYQKQSGKKLK